MSIIKQKEYNIPQPGGNIAFCALTPPTRISFLGTSFWNVKEALLKIFNQFPFNLDESHIPMLKAMAAAAGDGGTPYKELADAIEKHGGISVTLDSAIQENRR